MTRKVLYISNFKNEADPDTALNKAYKRVLFVALTLILVLGGIWYLGKLLNIKHSEKMYRYFRESDQSYDVLFFGSSHIKNAISPNDLYHEYGIRGYNLSMQGNYLDSNYYMIRECLDILEKTKRPYPEMIVMDTYDGVQEPGNLHNAWDSLPLDGTKIQMIKELADDDHKMGFYFPFSLYHNRWNEIVITDFEVPYNNILGIEPGYELYKYDSEWVSYPEMKTEKMEVSNEVFEKIDRIMDLCDERGIKLVFVYVPDRRYSGVCMSNTIKEYVESRGGTYINFEFEDTGIDYDRDFMDEGGHLNIRGARKITHSLGEILSKYGLPDRRGDENSAVWDSYYSVYLDDARKRIEETPDIDPYLADTYKGEL